MATTTTGNVNTSGQMLQTYLNKKVLENLEPDLRFHMLGKKPTRQSGYAVLAWTRVTQMRVSAAASLLTQGVTGTEEDFRMTTISLTPKQYGMYIVLADFLLDSAPLNLISEGAKEVGNNMARIVDEVIQSNLETNGTNVLYGGTATSRVTIGATDVATASDLAKANAFLSTKAARPYDDSYVAVMHPNVIYDLQQEAGTGTFIDVNKYNNANKIFTGEIGKLFNVRIIKSAFIQTFISTVTVYPTYIVGQGAYGVATLQTLKSYITPRKASDSDPLAQRVKVGSKVAFESIILQQDALLRLETASSLAYAW